MGTLAITKTYLAGLALTEVDIDAFRNGLLALFNTNKLSSTNFSGATALTSTHFTGSQIISLDDDFILFGATSDGLFGLDTTKNMVFNTVNSLYEIRFYAGDYYTEIATDKLNIPGDIVIGAGNSGKTVLQALSSYRKPVLAWGSSTAVTLQNNSGTTDNTVIYFPTFVASVTEAAPSKFRFAAINVVANGYTTGHIGPVLGGRRATVALTANSWYYVYAVKVKSGTEFSATTAKFVMVYDTVSPLPSNTAALNGFYGVGSYVYLGTVRYGFGAIGTSTSIPKFLYSNKGRCTFYEADTGTAGINLAYSTTDADNLTTALYTFVAGTSGNVLPETIGHVTINVYRTRASDWKIRETAVASSDVIWAGGWETYSGIIAQGFLIELPNIAGYSVFQERKSLLAGTPRGVTLAGFVDGHLLNRRHGHGI